jgi:hypothetical protein
MQVATILKNETVDFVKINIEGAELERRRTIVPPLQTQCPWMLIKILPVYRADYSGRFVRQIEIETLVVRHGFKLLHEQKGGLDPALLNLDPVETIGIHGDISYFYYALLPLEAVEQVERCGFHTAAAG